MSDSILMVADSGSTKTEWRIAYNNKEYENKVHELHTKGINPVTMDAGQISEILINEVKPFVDSKCGNTNASAEVHFYGAGCIDALIPEMKRIIAEALGRECTVNVYSDLMGAARALYGDGKGIACILGTGANSGLYDGKRLCKRVAPLGYILGDEGSGAYLGKRLVADILKGLMPEELCRDFHDTYNMDESDIIRKVYRESGANRFLASFTHFMYRHRENEYIQKILRNSFSEFFTRNILPYNENCEVGFVGSIACIFEKELREAAGTLGVKVGEIIKSPAEKLFDCHKNAI